MGHLGPSGHGADPPPPTMERRGAGGACLGEVLEDGLVEILAVDLPVPEDAVQHPLHVHRRNQRTAVGRGGAGGFSLWASTRNALGGDGRRWWDIPCPGMIMHNGLEKN